MSKFEDRAIALINLCATEEQANKVFEKTCTLCCYSTRCVACDRCKIAVAFDNWKPLVLEPKFTLAYKKA